MLGWQTLNTSRKLIIGIGIPLLCFVFIIIIGLSISGEIKSNLNQIDSEYAKQAELLGSLEKSSLSLQHGLEKLSAEPTERSRITQRNDNLYQNMQNDIASLLAGTSTTNSGLDQDHDFVLALNQLQQSLNAYYNDNNANLLNSQQLGVSSTTQYQQQLQAGSEQLHQNIESMINERKQAFNKAFNNVYQVENRLQVIILISIGLVLCMAGASVLLIRGLNIRLCGLNQSIREMSKNRNFGMRFNDQHPDEIGETSRAVDHLLESMQAENPPAKPKTGKKKPANKPATAETSKTEQALQQINESLKLIDEAERKQAQARQVESKNSKKAEKQKAKSNSASSLNELSKEIDKAASVISDLENASVDIGAILETICAIADQTNLLALNAAIEASRSGEQGRGFAVVADEVRGLAKRTQESTEEIRTLIQRLQQGASKVAEAMHNSRNSVDESIREHKHQQEHVLDHVKEKAKHHDCFSMVRAYLDGKDGERAMPPPGHSECQFGDWYYNSGNESFSHMVRFQQLEKVHVKLHALLDHAINNKDIGEIKAAEFNYMEAKELMYSLLTEIVKLQDDVLPFN